MATTKPRKNARVKEVDGVLYVRCKGPLHESPVWLPGYKFYKLVDKRKGREGRIYFQFYCKDCVLHRRAKERGQEVRVKVEPYHKFLIEIVNRCGGYNIAARTIGVPPVQMLGWLGRVESKKVKTIRRYNARKIISTLHGLRIGTIEPVFLSRVPTKRTYKVGCSGCGEPLENKTPGCQQCFDRHLSRQRRQQEKKERKVIYRIVAPSIEVGYEYAKLLRIPRKYVHVTQNSLRGITGKDTTFLVVNEHEWPAGKLKKMLDFVNLSLSSGGYMLMIRRPL